MKGAHHRYLERSAKKSFHKSISLYEQTLNRMVDAIGDGRNYRQDERTLVRRLKPNEVYAVLCQDDSRYWRSVLIKANPMTGGFRFLITNPVYGDPPPQMDVVPQEQVFKQMREMNAGNLQSLNAFPHRGASGPDVGGGQR